VGENCGCETSVTITPPIRVPRYRY
jgi:hypothetical protein